MGGERGGGGGGGRGGVTLPPPFYSVKLCVMTTFSLRHNVLCFSFVAVLYSMYSLHAVIKGHFFKTGTPEIHDPLDFLDFWHMCLSLQVMYFLKILASLLIYSVSYIILKRCFNFRLNCGL